MNQNAKVPDEKISLAETTTTSAGDDVSSTRESFRESTGTVLDGGRESHESAAAAPDVFAEIERELGDGEKSDGFDGHLQKIFPDLPRRFPADLPAEGFALGILDLMESLGGHATKEQTLMLLGFARSTWGRLAREALEKSPWKLPALAALAPEDVSLLRKNLAWLQVNDGCSVGCSFCGMNAEKLSGKFMDTIDALRLAEARGGFSGPTPYLASDPLDWKGSINGRELHYFDLHALMMGIRGYIPYVATALPRGKEELYRKYQGWIQRTSVIPSNRTRLEKLYGPSTNGVDYAVAAHPLVYPNNCRGTTTDYYYVGVLKWAVKPGVEKRKDWPEAVHVKDGETIACETGTYVTPKNEGTLQNHLVFLKGEGAIQQGFINQPLDFSRFSEPLPDAARIGGTAGDTADKTPLLRELLSMGIVKFDIRKYGICIVGGRLESGGRQSVKLISIANHTGSRRYLYFENFPGKVDCTPNELDGASELTKKVRKKDPRHAQWLYEKITIFNPNAQGKEYLHPLANDQFLFAWRGLPDLTPQEVKEEHDLWVNRYIIKKTTTP